MSAFDFSSAHWRKSSHSGPEGTNCVEVAAVRRKSSHSGQEGTTCVELARHDRIVAVRDSKDPEGPMLAFSRSAWRAFTDRVSAARSDLA